jgi:hypothetical protein
VQGWMGRGGIARLGSWCLLGCLLMALSVPRFGLVWHEHEDPDDDHPEAQLLKLLASSRASHPHHQPSRHSETAHVSLSSAETPNLHGHYVAASLLVFCSLSPPLMLTLLRVSLRLQRHLVLCTHHIATLFARGPPRHLLRIPSCCANSVRGLSRAVCRLLLLPRSLWERV